MGDVRGFGGTRIDTPLVKSAAINVAGSGDNSIVAAVTGKKIAVLGTMVVATGTVNVKFKDGSTDLTGDVNLQAREGFVLPVGGPQAWWWIGTVTTALNLNLSAAIAVDGIVTYMEID